MSHSITVTAEHGKKATVFNDSRNCLLATAIKEHFHKEGEDDVPVVVGPDDVDIGDKTFHYPRWCNDWAYNFFNPKYTLDGVCEFPFVCELTEKE